MNRAALTFTSLPKVRLCSSRVTNRQASHAAAGEEKRQCSGGGAVGGAGAFVFQRDFCFVTSECYALFCPAAVLTLQQSFAGSVQARRAATAAAAGHKSSTHQHHPFLLILFTPLTPFSYLPCS